MNIYCLRVYLSFCRTLSFKGYRQVLVLIADVAFSGNQRHVYYVRLGIPWAASNRQRRKKK